MNGLLASIRRFTIRTRMHGAIAVVIGLFAVLGLVGILGGQRLKANHDQLMAHVVHEMQAVSAARHALSQVRLHEKQMVIDYEDGVSVLKSREAWGASIQQLTGVLNSMLEGEEDEDNPIVRESVKHIDTYVSATKSVLENVQNGAYDNARVVDRVLGRAKEAVAKVEANVERVAKIVETEAHEASSEFSAAMQALLIAFGATLALVVLVVVPLTLLNSRSITQPIGYAATVAEAIAQGDLTRPIHVQGRDEPAQLLSALDRMQKALRDIVGEVRVTASAVQNASAEVASGNSDLSSRTEQAAGQLQQTASSMSQLTVTVQHSADSAAQANQLAASAADVAQRGGQVVSQVVDTMQEINTSSKRIADIISVIDGIAFQTNILALNAAVEAARAGEQGRGFAVVAGEVRSLAQRSAEAAREIKGLIGASVDRVEAGSKLVADAGATMNEIVASVQRVTDIIGEISSATREQSGGISSVSGAVAQLDQMTQQNAALVEESAAAAESLKSQAQRLSDLVSRFRLDGHATSSAVAGSVATIAPISSAPAAPSSASTPPPATKSAEVIAKARASSATPAPLTARAKAPAKAAVRPAPSATPKAPAASAVPMTTTAAAAADDGWDTF